MLKTNIFTYTHKTLMWTINQRQQSTIHALSFRVVITYIKIATFYKNCAHLESKLAPARVPHCPARFGELQIILGELFQRRPGQISQMQQPLVHLTLHANGLIQPFILYTTHTSLMFTIAASAHVRYNNSLKSTILRRYRYTLTNITTWYRDFHSDMLSTLLWWRRSDWCFW